MVVEFTAIQEHLAEFRIVPDRPVQAGRAARIGLRALERLVRKGHLRRNEVFPGLAVSRHESGTKGFIVVVIGGFIHAERIQDGLPEILRQRFPGNDLDQIGDHFHVTVVVPVRARLESQREAEIELHEILDRRPGSADLLAGFGQCAEVAVRQRSQEAGRMAHQMGDRNRAVGRDGRETAFAVFDQNRVRKTGNPF